MDLRDITPELSVSPQIRPEDLPDLAAQGFRVLINNRPDAEVDADEDGAAMQAAAEAAGIAYRAIPFVPGQVTQAMVDAQAEALALPGRKLAYCRSGNRSTVLWALTEAGRVPTEVLLQTAARAGYDLSGVRPMIEALAARQG